MLNRTRRLLTVFALYLSLIALFSLVYFGIYLKDPNSFSFGSDILANQRDLFRHTAEADTARLHVAINAVQALDDALSRPRGSAAKEWTIGAYGSLEVSGNQYGYRYEVFPYSGTDVVGRILHIRDSQGGEIAAPEIRHDSRDFAALPDTSGELARKELRLLVSDRDEIVRRLGTLGDRSPQVWEYSDFLYFSTITQASVGYGDILPNRPLVRQVVMLQILVSTVLGTNRVDR